MTIIFKVDHFLFELFPVEQNNFEELEKFLKNFYTEGPFEPKIELNDKLVTIEIDTTRIHEDTPRYKKLVTLCENGDLARAKILAKELISNTPNVSEYHRILGQIYSDEGFQDQAINCLIDALRWNPKNEWALLMMGNIFARHKEDTSTAMTYYDQVLVVKPNDNIALNNIGANLMQLGKTDDALKYFHLAREANSKYPNTHFAIALTDEIKQDYNNAFVNALIAVKVNPKKDGLYTTSLKLAMDSARKLVQEVDAKKIVEDLAAQLEKLGGKEIRVEIDEEIPTAAKIEFAENYNRDYHLAKYKSNYPAVEHLVMHEFMHLKLVLEARKTGVNDLFTSTQKNRALFFADLKSFTQKLKGQGIGDEPVNNYIQALFDGINRQIYNVPIDLFIEDRIYENYPELKAFQFLSIMALLHEGIEAATSPDIVKNSPETILSKSKVLNIVIALHFKELFAIDLVSDFKPSKSELKLASDLYEEFCEYRDDKKPGEEYELIQHWAEDLELENYFELIPEDNQRQKSMDQVLSEMEKDPFGLDTRDSFEERKMKKFIESHSSDDLNPAVAMHMIGALEYFSSLSKESIKSIAFEFATLGIVGINPDKSGYTVPSIKDRSFSGYKALAYYYVGFALAIPDMLEQLQMPFGKEYQLAETFYKSK
jgi:hypothetical protein